MSLVVRDDPWGEHSDIKGVVVSLLGYVVLQIMMRKLFKLPIKVTSVAIKEETPTVKVNHRAREEFRRCLEDALKTKCDLKVNDKNSDLIVSYKIIQYNPGSRIARWFRRGAGNAGKGSITVDAVFLTQKGKEVGRIQAEGKIQSGFFGGSFSYAIKEVAEQIGEYIREGLVREGGEDIIKSNFI